MRQDFIIREHFWAWVVIITVLVLIASARQKSIEAAETKGVQSNTTATGPKPQSGVRT